MPDRLARLGRSREIPSDGGPAMVEIRDRASGVNCSVPVDSGTPG